MGSEDRPDIQGARVRVTTADDVTVIEVSGVVDMLSAPTLTDTVHTALQTRPPALLIDLTDVDFLASAGLEVLVNAHKLAQPSTRLAVAADGPATSRPIRITQIHTFVPLYATVPEALSALATPAPE